MAGALGVGGSGIEACLDGSGFTLTGQGPDVDDGREFMRWLAWCDRSTYTQRSYAQGLAHFLRWTQEHGVALGRVDRQLLGAYLAEFEGKDGAARRRQPATVNHRLSVLACFFSYLARRDRERGAGAFADREPPLGRSSPLAGSHEMPGRDPLRPGRRGEFRRRVPRQVLRGVAPEAAVALIGAARSERDKALLTLLWRSGQRVGDWSDQHGRHGVLGMALGDLDRAAGTVTVRLKGARDEHRVPVADDFWPLFVRYVATERGPGTPEEPAWLGMRRGAGRPLTYGAFESALRDLGERVGVRVSAHMFRHALGQALVEEAGLEVAREVLGHAHISTTANSYARVDEDAMAQALARVAGLFDLAAREPAAPGDAEEVEGGYLFDYDHATLAELEQAAGRHGRRSP